MGKIQNSFSAILLLAVSVSVVVLLDHSRANQLAVFVPLVFALTVLVVVSTNESTMINTVLGSQYLVYLGTISYGIYMVHAAIWYVLRQTLRFGFQLPVETDSEGKVSVVFGNIYLADIVVIIGVALIVLTAHLSYRFIETKFNLKRQKVSID
jgi:peptidoglycan/LPS O-acetylase OafA/YrhL